MTKPNAKRLARMETLVANDRAYAAFGTALAGMDEAGRGPLLGCVTAGCVVMPAEPLLPWVDDSKKLSALRREQVYEEITQIALYWAVGTASAQEIDEMNILQATKLAMKRAAEQVKAQLCLVDAVTGLDVPFPTQSVIHGDAVSYSIAAASIVAKVTRDRQMARLAQEYPQYGLERNMGYGTKEHIDAIRAYGPCPEHRMSFIGKFIS